MDQDFDGKSYKCAVPQLRLLKPYAVDSQLVSKSSRKKVVHR